jgi:hypothetical protein
MMTVQNLSIEEVDPEDSDIISFSQFNDEHRANACCELPEHIFIKAVQLARHIDWEKDSPYWNNWEVHPAIQLVCDWWNKTAPDLSVRCAVSFDFVARVDNGPKYIGSGRGMYMNSVVPNGDYPVAHFSNCNARLGDFLLFTFQKGKAAYIEEFTTRNGICFTTYLVNGDLYCDTEGDSIDSADDSLSVLSGLAWFPETFPRSWAAITEESEKSRPDRSKMSLEDLLLLPSIDPSLLSSIMEVEGRQQLKILVTHEYSTLPELEGFITNLDPLFVWNLAASIQYYHSDFDLNGVGLDGLQLIHLLCRFHDCIPFYAMAKHFDCTLDLYWNWEGGILNSDWESSGDRMWREEFLSVELKKEIQRISNVEL